MLKVLVQLLHFLPKQEESLCMSGMFYFSHLFHYVVTKLLLETFIAIFASFHLMCLTIN